ncbi:MAG: lactate utilization protein [Chloroflexota bacterium]
MVDETDTSEEVQWYYKQRAEAAAANMQKRNINALYVPTRQEALIAIMAMIPEGAAVGRGDSITMEQIGVIEELAKRNKNKMVDPFMVDAAGNRLTLPERRQKQREALTADIFLTGTNAVTLDGKFVSTDMAGNRVAATIFGPKKVIVAAGVNKIVRNIEEALDRIHNVATPLNAHRHYMKHHAEAMANLPCVKTGRCADCFHEARLCRYTIIVEGSGPNEKGRINVVLVGEELGL